MIEPEVLIPQIKGHDGDDVRFVLDQHLSIILYSASSMKQQYAWRKYDLYSASLLLVIFPFFVLFLLVFRPNNNFTLSSYPRFHFQYNTFVVWYETWWGTDILIWKVKGLHR
jgi:hypothetical protein